jgi:hypothetical protein
MEKFKMSLISELNCVEIAADKTKRILAFCANFGV